MSEAQKKEEAAESHAEEHGDTCGVSPDLLEVLACPLGKADLELRDGGLVCTRCGPVFKIEDGIPIMLIDEAELPDGVEKIEDLPCQKEGS